MGSAVATLGDVDKDGVDDYAVGSSRWSDRGRVIVFSGATGATLLEILGIEYADDGLGTSVAGLSDLDGDGYPEILIGAPYFSFPVIGAAIVYSTKDGSELRLHSGRCCYTYFGVNVAALKDVDGDGVNDYAVHAQEDTSTARNAGRVYVYSGATGAELWSVFGIGSYDDLGRSLSNGGDIDGDGYSDVICGGLGGSSGGGHFDGYSGKTGALLFRIDAIEAMEQFGSSCDMVGDADGDGVGDYLVGAISNTHDGRGYSGRATLYSGRTLRPLYTFYPGYRNAGFGYVVRGGSDFNRDGIDDFVISGPYVGLYPGPIGGRVSIFAGNDLYLQADKADAVPGDSVTFDTRGGVPGSFAELVLVDISGTPMFEPLDFGFLDVNGELSSTLGVPDEATGLDFTFISYAVKLTHKPKWNDSSTVVVAVQ